MPEGERVREENLSFLSARDPGLAQLVRESPPDRRFTFLQSRTGLPVPVLRTATGTVALHSQYDPRAEARRTAESLSGAGCVVVFGLGAGFLPEALLEDPACQALIVVEKDAAVLHALLSTIPMTRLLRDARVVLAVGADAIPHAVLSAWKPALMGGLRTTALRAWRDQEEEFFDAAAIRVQAAIDSVRADFSVQSHFGKRWVTNILANLPHLARTAGSALLHHAGSAVVTAAGPSLEDHLVRLAAADSDSLLVATDTSLPALLRSGVQPNVVLSIDCQVYSYHHFLQGLPRVSQLYLDVASPPLLSRSFPAVFIASGHPLVRYIDAHWIPLLHVDTSGGNVTHAAVSLARQLGARRIDVLGADFSYPRAKAYARGTYLYDYFWTEQTRLSPAESSFMSFVLRGATAESRRGELVYSTPLLRAYRERFESLMASMDAQPVSEKAARAVPRGMDWREFLRDYGDAVRAVPFRLLNGDGRELWNTILPVAACIVREGCLPGPEAAEQARHWVLGRIQRSLSHTGV